MSGGGAHAAYQVGVLQGVARLLPAGARDPFQIYCGTSAGAINCAALAAYADNFPQGVRRLAHIWGHFHVDQVFAADWVGLAATSGRWFLAMLLGGLGRYQPLALLNRRPLEQLLTAYLPLDAIATQIHTGVLRAVSVTASSYGRGQSVTFFEGAADLRPWQRADRCGRRARLTVDHLLASSAIPFVFAPVGIDGEYLGDGSMRQTAPLSAALHLGAKRLLVIGAQAPSGSPDTDPARPSFAQIAGHVLNSIFLEGLDADLERLERINQTVRTLAGYHQAVPGLAEVECLAIHPSVDLAALAHAYYRALPRSVRCLLGGLGGLRPKGAALSSYLLFESGYCRALMALGVEDAFHHREALFRLFSDVLGADGPLNSSSDGRCPRS
ncbi:MAG: patatin-like phospholipase family protein [Acidiferrobacter sp.]